jgi:hypothetical protein
MFRKRTTDTMERPNHDEQRLDERTAEESITSTRPGPGELTRDWIRTLGLLAMFGLAVVETLLGFRLGFQLAGANATGFVDFIYDITGPLVEPFNGIGSIREVGDGGGIFEPATVVAMLVYFAAAMLLVAMLWTIASFPMGERSTSTYREDRSHARREER